MSTRECPECRGSRTVIQPAGTLEYFGRSFEVPAGPVPCPACSVARISGIRTNATTEQKAIQPVVIEAQPVDGQLSLRITEGAVTGYEGCYFSDQFKDWCREKGWWACAGTKGRWDGLFIPPEQMRQAFEKLRLT